MQSKNSKIKIDESKLLKASSYTYKKYKLIFPFQPYSIQKTFMNSVLDALDSRQHALLESPTGTGKTMCLLVAIMTWLRCQFELQRQQTVGEQESRPKLIYLSRTHHQLKQVVRELKKTCFLPRVITASSRDHACVNTQVNSLKGHNLEIECRKSIGLGIAISQEKKKVEVHACNYYYNISNQVRRQKNSQPVIRDLEEVKSDALKNGYCPFFLTRQFQIRENADVILMPYNYLLQHNTFGIYAADIKNSIIVFDQAHNVLGSAADGHSFRISLDMIGLSMNELKNVQAEYYQLPWQQRQSLKLSRNGMEFLGRRLKIFASNLYAGQQKMLNTADQYSNGVMMQYDRMVSFLFSCILIPGEETSKASEIISQMVEVGTYLMAEFPTVYNWSLDKTCGFLTKVNRIIDQWLKKDQTAVQKIPWDDEWLNYYRLHLKVEISSTVLELWCLDPSVAFRQILKCNPYNIILTSGTLSPLYSWQAQLKIPFGIKLINEHVIKSKQLLVACVSKVNTSRMLFSYQNRSNRLMIADFGNFLLKVSETVPHGILVVFPSYSMLADTRMQLIDSKIWEKINLNKEIMAEPKEQNKLAELLLLYGKKAKTRRGAFLFGVFRGKISEGIDLSDELCRAVIVVGVPYPPVKDLKIEEKRKYLDMRSQKETSSTDPKLKVKSIDGRTWYTLHTIRAVNQAIGRVIRHIRDYGAIYFVDSRYFSNQQLGGLISSWAKPALRNYQDLKQLMTTTEEFFQRNTLQFGNPSESTELVIGIDEEAQPEPLPKMPIKKLSIGRTSSIDKPDREIKENGRNSNFSVNKKQGRPSLTLDNFFKPKRTKW